MLYVLGLVLGISVATCVIFSIKTIFHWRERRSYRKRYWTLKDSLQRENSRLVDARLFANGAKTRFWRILPEAMHFQSTRFPALGLRPPTASRSSSPSLSELDSIYPLVNSDSHPSGERNLGDFHVSNFSSLSLDELENYVEFYLHQREILKITEDIFCVTSEIQSQAVRQMISRGHSDNT